MPIIGAAYLFTYILDGFAVQHPEIKIDVKQYNYSPALKMLERGESNLAIIVDGGMPLRGFDSETVLVSEFVYCVSPEHPFARRDSLDFPDLCSEPLVLNQDDAFITTQVKKRFYDLGFAPNILLYATQLPLIQDLVSLGKAGTFLSRELATSLPGITSIRLAQPITITYKLVWKTDRYISPSMKKFIEYTRNM